MGYTNCLMVSQMKELDLFDNISYKYIKDIINNDDDDIEVEIEDLDCDRVAWCKTRFTFELNIDVSGGSMPIMVDKKFVVEKEYNGSSAYALMMCQIDTDDERLTDEEEEEEVKCGICEKKLEDTSKCDYNDDIGEYCCKEPNCLRKFWGDCDRNEEEEEEED